MDSQTNISTPAPDINDGRHMESPEGLLAIDSEVSDETLCYIFSLASVGLLFGISIVACLIICCLLRKIRQQTSNSHCYEEIYSTKSEISTLDLTTMRFVSASGTVRRYRRNSGLTPGRLSNHSSIYAEISESGDRLSYQQHFWNSRSATNPRRVSVKFMKDQERETSYNDESVWTENILYEKSNPDFDVGGDNIEAIKRRYTVGHSLIGKPIYIDVVHVACFKRRKTM